MKETYSYFFAFLWNNIPIPYFSSLSLSRSLLFLYTHSHMHTRTLIVMRLKDFFFFFFFSILKKTTPRCSFSAALFSLDVSNTRHRERKTEGEKTSSFRCLIIPKCASWTWRLISRKQSQFVNLNDHVSLSQSIDLNTNDDGHGTVTMWIYLQNSGNTWLWFSSVRWCQCLTIMVDLIIRRWRE